MDIEERLQKIEEKLDSDKVTKVAILNIDMTLADTEYHCQSPKNLRGFYIKSRDGTAFRFAFEEGKVGTATPSPPYYTCPLNGHIDVKNIVMEELHLYVACAGAGKTVEIFVWSNP